MSEGYDFTIPNVLVSERAFAVGFQKEKIADVKGAAAPSLGVQSWTASYAQLLLCNADLLGSDDLFQGVASAQEWIDLRCQQLEETAKSTIDAYLLVLLSKAPTPDVLDGIRALELNPVACRKHFAWPIDNAVSDELRWARILRVTCLAIPTSPSTSGMVGSPKLQDELQIAILEKIHEHGGSAAANLHAANIIEGSE